MTFDCSGFSLVCNTSTEDLELLSLFQEELSGGNFDTEEAIMREMYTLAWRMLKRMVVWRLYRFAVRGLKDDHAKN